MTTKTYEPIDTAPRDGTLIFVSRSDHPEWGEQLMEWNAKKKLWEGMVFAPIGPRVTYWDRDLPQPDQWRAVPSEAS